MLISSARLFFLCAHGEKSSDNQKTTLIDPIFELTLTPPTKGAAVN
jgi:hypothetical protein